MVKGGPMGPLLGLLTSFSVPMLGLGPEFNSGPVFRKKINSGARNSAKTSVFQPIFVK